MLITRVTIGTKIIVGSKDFSITEGCGSAHIHWSDGEEFEMRNGDSFGRIVDGMRVKVEVKDLRSNQVELCIIAPKELSIEW